MTAVAATDTDGRLTVIRAHGLVLGRLSALHTHTRNGIDRSQNFGRAVNYRGLVPLGHIRFTRRFQQVVLVSRQHHFVGLQVYALQLHRGYRPVRHPCERSQLRLLAKGVAQLTAGERNGDDDAVPLPYVQRTAQGQQSEVHTILIIKGRTILIHRKARQRLQAQTD